MAITIGLAMAPLRSAADKQFVLAGLNGVLLTLSCAQ